MAAEGLDLKPVGNQCYATLIAVTGRERASITAAESEALDKALRALGWRPNEVALLCVPELNSAVSASTLYAYARALNAETLVLLERALLPQAPKLPWVKCAICADFFGSLGDDKKKRTAWIQLQAARRTPALTD